MNKEERNIDQELEQMRQDYAALKERFEKQQIINEQLMEKAFKSDIRRFSLDKNSGVITSALAIPLVITLTIVRKLEWWYSLAAVLLLLVNLWAVLRMYKNLAKDTLYVEDVLTVTTKVKRFKQQYQRFFLTSICAVVILIGTYTPTIYHSSNTPEQGIGKLVFLAIFVMAGIASGCFSYRRLMKSCDNILNRLEMKEDSSNNV